MGLIIFFVLLCFLFDCVISMSVASNLPPQPFYLFPPSDPGRPPPPPVYFYGESFGRNIEPASPNTNTRTSSGNNRNHNAPHQPPPSSKQPETVRAVQPAPHYYGPNAAQNTNIAGSNLQPNNNGRETPPPLPPPPEHPRTYGVQNTYSAGKHSNLQPSNRERPPPAYPYSYPSRQNAPRQPYRPQLPPNRDGTVVPPSVKTNHQRERTGRVGSAPYYDYSNKPRPRYGSNPSQNGAQYGGYPRQPYTNYDYNMGGRYHNYGHRPPQTPGTTDVKYTTRKQSTTTEPTPATTAKSININAQPKAGSTIQNMENNNRSVAAEQTRARDVFSGNVPRKPKQKQAHTTNEAGNKKATDGSVIGVIGSKADIGKGPTSQISTNNPSKVGTTNVDSTNNAQNESSRVDSPSQSYNTNTTSRSYTGRQSYNMDRQSGKDPNRAQYNNQQYYYGPYRQAYPYNYHTRYPGGGYAGRYQYGPTSGTNTYSNYRPHAQYQQPNNVNGNRSQSSGYQNGYTGHVPGNQDTPQKAYLRAILAYNQQMNRPEPMAVSELTDGRRRDAGNVSRHPGGFRGEAMSLSEITDGRLRDSGRSSPAAMSGGMQNGMTQWDCIRCRHLCECGDYTCFKRHCD